MIDQDKAYALANELIGVAMAEDGDVPQFRPLSVSLVLFGLDVNELKMVALAEAVTFSGFIKAIADRTGLPLMDVWAEYVATAEGRTHG